MDIKQIQDDLKKTLAALNEAHAALSKVKAEKSTTKQDIEDQHIARFRQTEFLAHVLPYKKNLDAAPQRTEILAGKATDINAEKISIVDEDGVERSYNVKKVNTNNDGLVCFIFYGDETDNPRVHVTFRGTHNKASVMRDLETFGSGPGSISFNENKHNIMQDIKQIVQHKQNAGTANVELSIAGHSLGGADAQMCATEVLKDIADNPDNNPLAKVAELHIMHANAAGVSYATGKIAQRSLEKIKANNHPLKVKQHIIHVGSDLVQQAGYTTILSKSNYTDVETNLLRAEIDPKYKSLADAILIFAGHITKLLGLKTYQSHTSTFFHGKKYDLDVKFKLYNNQNPEENLEISKQLKHKVLARMYKSVTPKKVFKKIKNMLHKARHGTKKTKVKPKNKDTT